MTNEVTLQTSGPGRAPNDPGPRDLAALRARAAELEAVFLAEMLGHAGLGHAGLGEGAGGFGGGIGEAQFASFLRQEQATAMVRAGGIGLAESIFRAMSAGGTGDDGR